MLEPGNVVGRRERNLFRSNQTVVKLFTFDKVSRHERPKNEEKKMHTNAERLGHR